MLHSPRTKRRLPALVGALTLTLAIACGGQSALAQNGADDEEVPLDTKLFRQFMKDLGLKRDGDDQIEYRERPPLVVPPGRNLPPPQSSAAGANNPAWPKDPDVALQKQEAAAKKKPRKTAAEAEVEAGRPLSRDELDRGRTAPGTPVGSSGSPEEGARPLRPSELGSKSMFSGIFSSFGPQKPESVPFAGEPTREKLTAPPPGYQTPSPNQPYGLSPKQDPAKPATLESRAVGSAN